MARRLRLLTGLSTIALTGSVALTACGGEGEGAAAGGEAAGSAHHGEAEAEGAAAPAAAAGGEAEGAAIAAAAADKASYLSALQIVRGHLRAGVELYGAGDRDLGPQHLRHPQAEILTSLAPAFAAYGASGVETAIDALASASERDAPPAEISRLETAALDAVRAASAQADATAKEKLLAAARTLTVAGDEYAIAVKDGAIVNLHEYHDAYGFIAVAIGDVAALEGAGAAEAAAIAAVLEQLEIASTAAPSINPPTDGLKPASVIYGAAARVEIIAGGL